jgi:hypothetical protein
MRQAATGLRTATAPLGPAQAAPRTPRAHTTALASVTSIVVTPKCGDRRCRD